jgi:hypothetical protein
MLKPENVWRVDSRASAWPVPGTDASMVPLFSTPAEFRHWIGRVPVATTNENRADKAHLFTTEGLG